MFCVCLETVLLCSLGWPQTQNLRLAGLELQHHMSTAILTPLVQAMGKSRSWARGYNLLGPGSCTQPT